MLAIGPCCVRLGTLGGIDRDLNARGWSLRRGGTTANRFAVEIHSQVLGSFERLVRAQSIHLNERGEIVRRKTYLKVEGRRQTLKIAESAQTAATYEIHTHSIAFQVPDPSRGPALGSGTLVAIDDRIFVATAGHNIPDDLCAAQEIRFIGTRLAPIRAVPGRIIRSGRGSESDPDVGFLELRAGVAQELGKSPITLARVRDHGAGRARKCVMLVGAPVDGIQMKAGPKGRPVQQYGMNSLLAQIIPSRSWKDRVRFQGLRCPLRPSADVLIDYEEEVFNVNSRQMRSADHPRGTSGGGVWDLHIEPVRVWHAEHAALFAIRCSLLEQDKLMRSVQVRHWIALLRRRLPELRPELDRWRRREAEARRNRRVQAARG